MTAPSDGSLHGDSIESLQQELAATNVLLVALSRELSSQQVETTVRVEGLRAEQARERRVRMMYVAAGGTATIYAYDYHVVHCSPGARVSHALDWLLVHPARPGDDLAKRQQDFQRVYDKAPVFCDATLPIHTHDGSSWPTVADGSGLALVGLVVLVTAVYHRWRTRQDFGMVQKALEAEERSRGEKKGRPDAGG